ncbi:beta-N-acetylhexosaminidase [Sedimentibacter acidaminivorans]|uniref:beta-N-acetylhexosaminidase n=1 Tax=Sedimentibacter acidaminivorans TaxID=913099 RepID=A0ABS4GDS8_9FIRM|nr:glycoside hydrolase family 3 N-terminal domain-containing protein [Sedimentibacter acidaminivorans]MBP1925834.1 beta-N-acetylhexosaminidase [Sedimentibacter acidaminivorans]
MKKLLFISIVLTILLTACNKSNDNNTNDNKPPNEDPSNSDNITENNLDDKNIFKDYNEDALKYLEKLTLEEKIGQIFLARCPLEEDLNSFLSLNPGGFILFGRDFADKTRDEIISNIEGYQSASKMPMIIGVDEEGGTVVRASSNPLLSNERFKSPQELYEIDGFDEIKKDTILKSKFLLELGINLNLAPVADVSTNDTDFINQRSFGKSAGETSEYVRTVVNAMKESGISGTLKHFPGYGNNADTHTGSAYDKRPYENFILNDFLPFGAGIESNVESILISHNVVESIDANLPASLSKITHDILRNELNFTGVIMTDDMSMGAIQELETSQAPEVIAVQAGNDMLIVTDYITSYNSLLTAVKNGEISEERINESVLKILEWKYYMGIIK